MNHYTPEPLVRVRMQERLHEAEQERLARLAHQPPRLDRDAPTAIRRIPFLALRRLVARLAPAT